MRRVAVLAAVLMLVAASALLYAYQELRERYSGFDDEIYVQIERGARSRDIARLLAARGAVRHEWVFLLARVLRPNAVLQAGEYRFSGPASVWEIQNRLIRGDVFYHPITVPEGSNVFATAKIIASLDWVSGREAIAAVESPSLVAAMDPAAKNLEGYLFPSTYHVTRGTPAAEICRMMTDQFRKTWAGLRTDADLRRTVTLASLIEKETGRPDERDLVASVFHNRLRRGMRLESDPTTIYAAILENRYDGVIHSYDLESANPYNTYQHAGLPPGPIASPGAAALRAALQPAETSYLFFVARPDGSGGHAFSESLAAHNRAVAEYRRGTREAERQENARRVSEPEAAGTRN